MTEPGERMVTLSRKDVEAPASVDVIEITPTELKLIVNAPGEP